MCLRNFTCLYSSDQDATPDFDSFFKSLDIPLLDQPAAEELKRPITELNTAASSLQNERSPGPHAPLLLDMFSESFESGSFLKVSIKPPFPFSQKKKIDLLACTFIVQ